MKFQLQPAPQVGPDLRAGRGHADDPTGRPEVGPHQKPPATPSAATPSLRIGRVEIEGFGPISPACLREGFHAAWSASAHRADAWTAASPELFRAPLTLNITPGLDARELGRRLAQAILARADAAASRV